MKTDLKLSEISVSEFIAIVRGGMAAQPQPEQQQNEKRYVYGLNGISSLFGVSHSTAQRYKDTFLKDAIFQRGRKIIIDADKALELFNRNEGGNQ